MTVYSMDTFLLVSYDTDTLAEPGLVVTRKDEIDRICKMVIGEQAEIIYRLLTDQSLKAKIVENEG